VRRVVTAVLVVLLPLLFLANVLQVYRYNQLEQQLTSLERDQDRLIEENKRAILAIAILTSPDRVSGIAESELELEQILPENILRLVRIVSGGGQ
jgi:cell division protein FtsL